MITVSFTAHVPSYDCERSFESFSHLREQLRSIWFSPFYKIRSHENELGRVTARELLAVADDGRETYLGNVCLEGDKQG